jgi:hypothetical protein
LNRIAVEVVQFVGALYDIDRDDLTVLDIERGRLKHIAGLDGDELLRFVALQGVGCRPPCTGRNATPSAIQSSRGIMTRSPTSAGALQEDAQGTNGGSAEWCGPPVRLRNSGQLFLISILRSAFTASGLLAALIYSTPLSNVASTLASSMVSGSPKLRSNAPKLRSEK